MSSQDQKCARHNPVLGPHSLQRMPVPPVQHPPIGGNISQTWVAIATMTRRLVEHSAFIALCPSRTSTGDVGDDVGPSSTVVETSTGRPERAASEPHRCQSRGSIFFLPAEGVGRDSFMEEVSILMFCVFLIDYICVCVCFTICVFLI